MYLIYIINSQLLWTLLTGGMCFSDDSDGPWVVAVIIFDKSKA